MSQTVFLVARKRGEANMHTFFNPTPLEVEAILDVRSEWEVGEYIEWDGPLSVADWRAVRDHLAVKWGTTWESNGKKP